jgi:3-phosphoshikimate 1-carboxyvinyltransferase
MKVLSVNKADRNITGHIILPFSKSISNRALIIHAIAGFNQAIEGLSDADDTRKLKKLLLKIKSATHGESPVSLDCRDAGTVFRFLTAVLAGTDGHWLLTGTSRMKERPIGSLVDALRQLGVRIDYAGDEGFPPLIINGKRLAGRKVEIEADISSQFVSAMLMIAPALKGGLELILRKPVSSLPYIMMTLKMMDLFGVKTIFKGDRIVVPGQPYKYTKISIEPDWSSAAFWYELAAFSVDAGILLQGLKKNSLQGDAILHEIYNSFGVKTQFTESGAYLTKHNKRVSCFNFDFSNHPDLALPVIITCIGLNIPFNICGLENLRIKESDRLHALRIELGKIGIETFLSGEFHLHYETSGNIEYTLQKVANKAIQVSTWNDHRIAMAFAPLSMIFGTIGIENPAVVSKSYPDFWNELTKTGFNLAPEK